MPKPSRKQQKDHQELARGVLDAIAPEVEASKEKPAVSVGGKNPTAVALGRLGVLKGGEARAKS